MKETMQRYGAAAGKLIFALAVCGVLYWSVTQSISFGRFTADVAFLTPENTMLEKPPSAQVTALPADGDFQPVAESPALRLLADPKTGHFRVEDKRNGNVYRSYPDPEHMRNETTGGLWAKHLLSPVMYSYVQLNIRRDQVRESNWIEDEGAVRDFERIEGGFRLVYDIPKRGIAIPVRVTVHDDYVEAAIEDRLLQEEKLDLSAVKDAPWLAPLAEGRSVRVADVIGFGAESGSGAPDAAGAAAAVEAAVRNVSSLVSVRLYPFFGAVHSAGQDGYLLIPDGPGALIRFRTDRGDLKTIYNEKVYGEDLAFASRQTLSARRTVTLPVFGIKSGRTAFLALVASGEEYASILASPAGSFTGFNWAAAEHRYRAPYFQPTSTDREEGFTTYARERFRGDRAVRYYLLDLEEADYSGMAARFRRFLTEEGGLGERRPDGPTPLSVTLLAGAPEEGFLGDAFRAATTAGQAKEIVDALLEAGVRSLSVTYEGWHRGGYGVYGSPLPAESGIGGNAGLREFAAYAEAQGVPVYLDASAYSRNNAGERGFNRRRDGLRDLSGSIVSVQDGGMSYTISGNARLERRLTEDLGEIAGLGAAGLAVRGGFDGHLSSDFNAENPASRSEAKRMHERLLAAARGDLGGVKIMRSPLYALPYADQLDGMPTEGSYDVFVDEVVPFAPMALHGLIDMFGEPFNLSADADTMLLRSLEYGVLPSFVLTYADSRELRNTSLKGYYSTSYRDWVGTIGELYARFDEALGDVRNARITEHRTLADGVKETVYSNGKRIVVNYNEQPAAPDGTAAVDGRSYVIVEGGGSR